MNELNRQLIAMYAKQLRVPTFNQYEEVVRQLDGGKSFDDFLVSLMRAELENRQESNRKRKIRSARFPYTNLWRNLTSPIWNMYPRRRSASWPAATSYRTSRM